MVNTLFSQEVFERKGKEYLFIGGKKDDLLKFSRNGKIHWFKENGMKKIWKSSSREFITNLYRDDLQFEFEGYEPFWKAELFRDSIHFYTPESELAKSFKISYDLNVIQSNSGIYFGFKDAESNIYGFVNYLGFGKPPHDNICEFNIGEEDSFYEVTVVYDGIVYKGCSTIINSIKKK